MTFDIGSSEAASRRLTLLLVPRRLHARNKGKISSLSSIDNRGHEHAAESSAIFSEWLTFRFLVLQGTPNTPGVEGIVHATHPKTPDAKDAAGFPDKPQQRSSQAGEQRQK